MDSFGAIAEFAIAELSEQGAVVPVPAGVVEIIAPPPRILAGACVQQPAPLVIEIAAPTPQVLSGAEVRAAGAAVIDVVAPIPETGTVGALIDMGVVSVRETEPALAESEITGLGAANTFLEAASLNLIAPPPQIATGVLVRQPEPMQIEILGVAPEIGARRQPSRVQAVAS